MCSDRRSVLSPQDFGTMATKRVKRDCEGDVDDKANTMADDRISQLPDPLVQHIFSFLPTIYLVRMSHLSKRWRWMWVSIPSLYFDDLHGISFEKKRKNQDTVLECVNNYLKARSRHMQIPNGVTESFKFDTLYRYKRIDFVNIDGWLKYAIQNKVKELDLRVKHYTLPQFLLNASPLTQLKLCDTKLDAPSSSTFPLLKSLSLENVELNSESIRNLLSGCPVIEDFHLGGYIVENIDLPLSGTLKNLSLSHVELTDEWLDGLLSKLHLLEKLSLRYFKLGDISIRSCSLKYLFFNVTSIRACLATPNLVWLSVSCNVKSVLSIDAPNLLEAKLRLIDCSMVAPLYAYLVSFLSNLGCMKKLNVYTHAEEVICSVSCRACG